MAATCLDILDFRDVDGLDGFTNLLNTQWAALKPRWIRRRTCFSVRGVRIPGAVPKPTYIRVVDKDTTVIRR